jgi:hypothetical protein
MTPPTVTGLGVVTDDCSFTRAVVISLEISLAVVKSVVKKTTGRNRKTTKRPKNKGKIRLGGVAQLVRAAES